MPAHAPRQALLARRPGRQVVTALGATGHQTIPPGAREFVVDAVRDILRRAESPLLAVTSLAAGADQLVATELLRAGGHLHVIVPSGHYERTFTTQVDLASFRSLLEAADAVTRLDYAEPSEEAFLYAEPSEEAFLAAGKRVVDDCEMLIAIWDGKPARGLGGTADVVRYAQDTGKAVSIVWPDGAGR
jgi:hypothetical protein